MTRVIDASIACKWYLDEDGSKEARTLLEEMGSPFIAPDIILAEVTNVLWLRLRRGEIGEAQATLAANHLADSFLTLDPLQNGDRPGAEDCAADRPPRL